MSAARKAVGRLAGARRRRWSPRAWFRVPEGILRNVVPMRAMMWLSILGAGYLALALLVFLLQDRMLFLAAGSGRGIPLELPPGVVIERLEVSDGLRVRVACCQPRNRPNAVILFFDGNGGDLRSGVHWARLLADCDLVALAVEYPGYGDSDGSPSKAAFEATALAAARLAQDRARALGVPLWACGVSLGTFSAVQLAASKCVARLLLLSPPTSVAEAAQRAYFWLPVRWLLRHPFDNLGLAAQVACPTLIVNGDRDDTVPLAMAQQLKDAIGAHCELFVAHGCGHNDLWFGSEAPFAQRVRAFLDGR